METLVGKSQLFFKNEKIHLINNDKHIFSSPFVFPKPTIKQKQESLTSKSSILFYENENSQYNIRCYLNYLNNNEYQIRKYIDPKDKSDFIGIKHITGVFSSKEKANVFYLKFFKFDFISFKKHNEISINELLFITINLLTKKEKHSLNYFKSINSYLLETNLINIKKENKLTFNRLNKPFNSIDILKYGLVYHDFTLSNLFPEADNNETEKFTLQLIEPIKLKNNSFVNKIELINNFKNKKTEFSILFAYSNFFDVDGIPLYWKNRKGTLRMSHHSGIHIYEPLLKHDKFENINEHSFPFSELTNAKISYYLKDWLIDGEPFKLKFDILYQFLGIKKNYLLKGDSFYNSAELLKTDIEQSLLISDMEFFHNITNHHHNHLNEYDSKYQIKKINHIINDSIFQKSLNEKDNENNFYLLCINYPEIGDFLDYLNHIRNHVLKPINDVLKNKHVYNCPNKLIFDIYNKIK